MAFGLFLISHCQRAWYYSSCYATYQLHLDLGTIAMPPERHLVDGTSIGLYKHPLLTPVRRVQGR